MEENLLFKNTSALSEKETKALTKVTIVSPLIMGGVVLPICFAILGGVWILLNDLDMAILMFAFAVAFAILYPTFLICYLKQINKKVINGRRLFNTFEFYESNLMITSQSLEESGEYFTVGTSNLHYNEIYKVLVTNDYVFIFINKGKSFILDNKGMIEGDIDELIKMLQTKVTKFKDKRKRK